jgi:hypothetical protein
VTIHPQASRAQRSVDGSNVAKRDEDLGLVVSSALRAVRRWPAVLYSRANNQAARAERLLKLRQSAGANGEKYPRWLRNIRSLAAASVSATLPWRASFGVGRMAF